MEDTINDVGVTVMAAGRGVRLKLGPYDVGLTQTDVEVTISEGVHYEG